MWWENKSYWDDYDEELDKLWDIQKKEWSDFFDDVSEFSSSEKAELWKKISEWIDNIWDKETYNCEAKKYCINFFNFF